MPAPPFALAPPPAAVDRQHGVWRASLGLALIVVGQPIAWTVRGAVGGGLNPAFPIADIILGFALLARVDWFQRPRFYPLPHPVMALVLLWLVPLAALSLLAPVEVGNDGAYALFVAAMLFCLALTPVAAFARLPEALTLVGGTSSALTLGSLAFGHALQNFARLTVAGTDNQAIAGSVGGVTMIAAVLVVRGTARPGVAIGAATSAAFIAGLAGVLLSNTRSVMVALAVCLPLAWWWFGPRMRIVSGQGSAASQRRAFTLIVGGALLAAPAAAVAVFPSKAREAILKQFTDRLGGAFTVFEADHFKVVDTSSAIRAHILEYTVRRLDLLGHGISEQIRSGFGYYPHLSYLQAFYDFGIPGGLLYLTLALVMPLMLIADHLRHRRLNPASAFAILYFLYDLGDQFGHTTPYGWTGLAAIGLVYVLVGRAGPSFAMSDSRSTYRATTVSRV